MPRIRTSALGLSALLALAAVPAAPSATTLPSTDGVGSPNMEHVANVQWDGSLRRADNRPVDSQGGTDVEFATIDGRDYAFSGTYRNGLQVIDVTDPEAPVQVATYDCQLLQGDVQVFQRDDRWLLTYTADGGLGSRASKCYADAGVTGNLDGTLLIDVTDPTAPRSIGFARVVGGSHNQTVHPSGKYLYNSNSGSAGRIEVIDITDPTQPKLLPLTTLPTRGDDSHDLTFNSAGTRAYSAALDHTLVIDTTDPEKPKVLGSITDPAITLHHQADPVTIDGREYVIINDELNGAGGNEVCPGGGLHVYDVTNPASPTKVGAWFSPEVTVREGAPTGLGGTVTCTSHVFRIHEEQQILTIAWFGAGVRVIDLSGIADTTPVAGGIAGTQLTPGMREVGYYRFPADSDAWSAKAYRLDEDGSGYIFANDQTRGLDVFRYDASAAEAEDGGRWLTPAQALAETEALRAAAGITGDVLRDLRPICDLRGRI
ncbi:MAG: LVIVD repeat-containing protein [Actinomycetes bacterium]